jgi:carbonic anhydrase
MPAIRYTRTVLLAALMSAAPAVLAATSEPQWEVVTAGAGSTVEIDKNRIARHKGGKTSAWTRLTLDHPVLDFENSLRYTVVQALNHYDCANNSFATQKRVFLLNGREMKTEKVDGKLLPAKPDSLDARVLAEVCKPRSVGEMAQTAQRAAAAAQAAGGEQRARVMHAEMVSEAKPAQSQTMKVADAHAPATTAPVPAPEKPRLFEMPLIDKSKAEDPYKGAAPASAAKETAPAPVPAPKAAAAPAKPAAIAPTPQDLSRQEREMLLATSGPRKVKPTKKVPEKAPAEPEVPDYSHVHWGYAGPGAPENWAKLRAEYATCGKGKRQSPIDIRGGIKVDLDPIRFDYRPTQFRIIDNGHTVQVDVADNSSITITGRTYRLVQFHFHRPSEERINGRQFEMVAHLVHKDYDGNLAVIAVPIDRGTEHPLIQTLWNHMPLEVGMTVQPPGVVIDLTKLLPTEREYYTYMGSLTTPPCTENVLWMVFKNPIQVSPEQVGIFARLYPNNARPIQPAHDRLIKESR